MTTHNGLPVSGYRPQDQDAIDLVNDNKRIEERCLRQIDDMERLTTNGAGANYDAAMMALARTRIVEGFMWLNRAVFRPGRVTLEDHDA